MIHFCIDIDNVIASTDVVMREVIAEFTENRVRLDYHDVQNFNYHECFDQSGNCISKKEWTKIHALFSEPRYLWKILPASGAIEGLNQLAEFSRIHLVTSRLSKARRVTVEWLENYGFPPHDLHFITHGEKHVTLRQFTAAVEDNYDQGKAFATEGGTPCFLMRHPWNNTKPVIDGLKYVDSWQELPQQLLDMAKATNSI